MKSILLVRHAKSSWDNDLNDFDRPLNQRGLGDAPAMAEKLLKNEVKIDLFVSSPAKRAVSTAAIFAEAYGKKPKGIVTIPFLYEPAVQSFYTAIEQLSDDFKSAAVFAHNPGITQFANKLTSVTIDDMPTCAVFAVKADIKKWSEFVLATKAFWFFYYPKQY